MLVIEEVQSYLPNYSRAIRTLYSETLKKKETILELNTVAVVWRGNTTAVYGLEVSESKIQTSACARLRLKNEKIILLILLIVLNRRLP